MEMRSARFFLFLIWTVLFFVYISLFLVLAAVRGDIDFNEAADASWKSAYILLPILSAFASFWFLPQLGQDSDDEGMIDRQKAAAIFILTGLVHLVVLSYFFFAVVIGKFDYSSNPNDSFAARVTTGHNWLVLLSSLAVLPVGFVLKRPDLKSLSPIGQPDEMGGVPTVDPAKPPARTRGSAKKLKNQGRSTG